MSTASGHHNTNTACCTIPPVQSEYTPKGSFKSVGDFKKVYVTGGLSENAILLPATQQGADIIAATLKTVGKKALQQFFAGTANPPAGIIKLTTFGEALKTGGASTSQQTNLSDKVTSGGKVVLGAAGESTPSTRMLSCPLGIYISKDEYIKILEVIAKKPFATKNDNKYYSNMFHGWAAARADLKVQDNKEE
ncbi:hypothetical protein B0H10DRAFT_2104034 [Mycena sp. CBHHK59/15]|nr:hypothetical protein B0H10DRAFT_2104034 [Mycena sp. CBHHK59/15]